MLHVNGRLWRVRDPWCLEQRWPGFTQQRLGFKGRCVIEAGTGLMRGDGLTCLEKKNLQAPNKQAEIPTRASAASAELPLARLIQQCSSKNQIPCYNKKTNNTHNRQTKSCGCRHTMHLCASRVRPGGRDRAGGCSTALAAREDGLWGLDARAVPSLQSPYGIKAVVCLFSGPLAIAT